MARMTREELEAVLALDKSDPRRFLALYGSSGPRFETLRIYAPGTDLHGQVTRCQVTPKRLDPLVPRSAEGNPLRGPKGSTRRWIWDRRGYGGTVKVFWDLREYPDHWKGLEWRTDAKTGKLYAALTRRD